jgi:molybdenum cofactor biosynthesis protein B
VVLTTGGTGFTGRDITPEALEPLFEKAHGRLLGSVPSHLLRQDRHLDDPVARHGWRRQCDLLSSPCPGSPGACRDAWDGILKFQLDYRHMPCNFVEIMPRLDEHLRRGAGRS